MNTDLIKEKVSKVLDEKVISCVKLANGSCNHVYKVSTVSKSYVVRIFTSKTWPEEGKLRFITDKLIENNIFTAKNILITRNDEEFEKGYMIQEFLCGDDIQDAINDKISVQEYYLKLGKLMKKIHSIKIENYGYIGSGIASHETFSGFIDRELDSVFEDISKLKIYEDMKYQEIREIVFNNLTVLNRLPSVLTHSDLSLDNVMLVDNKLVLIDWDNAIASNWIHDYAYMTYWMYWDSWDMELVNKNKNIFLKSYNPNFDLVKLEMFEKVYHLFLSIKLMTWYKEGTEEFNKVVKYLEELYSELK